MRVAVAFFAIALVCILGIYLAQGTGRRMTRVTPHEVSKGWDASRIGLRQCGATVNDGSGTPMVRNLTIIGPTRRALPPWLDVEWTGAVVSIVELGAETRSLAATTRTIWWGGDGWRESPETIPDLPPPREGPALDRSIFDFLRTHAASKESLIATIETAVNAAPKSGVKK